ncbi:MAG: hypothetical protein VX764_04895 [Planctomycetota bacterium]|nr:hypothetical protein [Planctomycetota bacterium]
MMANSHDARERILALERIRVVETELVEQSLVLIRRLEVDLARHLNRELSAELLQLLHRGDRWWQPERNGHADDDPRAFPVVFEVAQQVINESQVEWQPDPRPHDGVSYQDLVPPLRELLARRTELARIAGVI